MIVWGGYVAGGPLATTNTGGRYNPQHGYVGRPLTPLTRPLPEYDHTAVWTGSEMIVWGGFYNGHSDRIGILAADTIPAPIVGQRTSTTNAPAARSVHTAVWTGSEMIVWGGDQLSHCLDTGGRYNPSTDTWTATSTTNAPDRPSRSHGSLD